jgi:hypothetical protein
MLQATPAARPGPPRHALGLAAPQLPYELRRGLPVRLIWGEVDKQVLYAP